MDYYYADLVPKFMSGFYSQSEIDRIDKSIDDSTKYVGFFPNNRVTTSTYQLLSQGTAVPQSQITIPTDMLGEISRHADLETTQALSRVSKASQELLTSDKYWIDRIKTDFPEQSLYINDFLQIGLKYPIIYRLLEKYIFVYFIVDEPDENGNIIRKRVLAPFMSSIFLTVKYNDVDMLDYCIAHNFSEWPTITGEKFVDIIRILICIALENGNYICFVRLWRYLEDSGMRDRYAGFRTFIEKYITDDLTRLKQFMQALPYFLQQYICYNYCVGMVLKFINLAIGANDIEFLQTLQTLFPGKVEEEYRKTKQRYEILDKVM